MARQRSLTRTTLQHLAIGDAAERGAVYALLSRLWAGYLNSIGLNWLNDSNERLALPDWFEIPSSDSVEALRDDYTQLFVGPKNQLPPYQSVWQFGQFEAAPAATMRTYIEVTGYSADRIFSYGGRSRKQYSNEQTTRMTDHVAVQLDLMSHLLDQAAQQKPGTLASQFIDVIISFHADCLTWFSPLCDAVVTRAQTPFYCGVARLTNEFLADEQSRFAPSDRLAVS